MTERAVEVLLIKDNQGDARLFQEILAEDSGMSFHLVIRGRLSSARAYLVDNRVDVILFDLGLPDSPGLDAFLHLKKECQHIPVIVLTGPKEKEMALRALQMGAQDYLVKGQLNGDVLFRALRYSLERKRVDEDLREIREKYRGVVENTREGICQITPDGRFLAVNQTFAEMLGYASLRELIEFVSDISHQIFVYPEERTRLTKIIEAEDSVKGFETEFYRKDGGRIWISMNGHTVKDVQGQRRYFQGVCGDITLTKEMDEERKQSTDRLRKALGCIIQATAVTVEVRDPYTAGHQRRVADLARTIAREMGLSADRIDGLRLASMIHDVGKIAIPAEILSKPTKLAKVEFSLIKRHVQAGYDILKDIDFPWPIARMVLEHHERVDGSGYPNGITGKDMLTESWILGVADVVEAIASNRPYRPAHGLEMALNEISTYRNSLYDPEVVDCCLGLFKGNGYRLEHAYR